MRWRLIAILAGLFVVGAITGVIVRLPHDQETKDFVEGDVPSKVGERGGKELEQGRKEKLQSEAETYPVNKELEPLGKPKLQTVAEGQAVDKGGAPPKQEPPSDTKKLAALQKQVDALQEELSLARQKLEEERRKVAFLEGRIGDYRQNTANIQRRTEELEKQLGERDYLQFVNEALAYTYRKEPGDAERAESAYKNAVRIAQAKNIQDPMGYNAYATFLQEQSRFKEAEKFYQMALGVNPRYGPALYNLGTLYEATGRLEEALEKYKAADEAGEKLGAQNYSRLQSVITK